MFQVWQKNNSQKYIIYIFDGEPSHRRLLTSTCVLDFHMCTQLGHKIKPNVNIDMFWKSDNTSSFSLFTFHT